MKNFKIITILLFAFAWTFSGCSAISFMAPTATPVPPTPTFTPKPTLTSTPTVTPRPTTTATPSPTATATLAIEVPPPAAGKANAAGLVLWNNEPVIYAKVLLCGNYDWGGCTGNEFSAITNTEGYYVFKNIKPGQYTLAVNIPNTNWYIYYTEKKEELKADQVVFIEPMHIFKVDLRVEYPADNTTINEASPNFKWREYPGAAYYVIWIGGYGDTNPVLETVETNEYKIEKSLAEGKHSWQVEAYNEDGLKISESEYISFTVDIK